MEYNTIADTTNFFKEGSNMSNFIKGIKLDIGMMKENEDGSVENIELGDIIDLESSKIIKEMRQNKEAESFVIQRLSDMEINKSEFNNIISQADFQYDSLSVVTKDNGSGKPEIYFNVPFERGIIDNIEADLGNNDIDYKIIPTGTNDDVNKVVGNEVLLDYIYDKDNTGIKVKRLRHHYAKYGFGVIAENVETRIKDYLINPKKDFDGNMFNKGLDTPIQRIETNLISRVVHPKNFYFDNGVLDFFDANDCIEIQEMSKEDIRDLFFFSEEIVKDSYALENISKILISLDDVDNKVMHYFNKRKGRHIILINEFLLFRGASIYGHGELPYAVAVMDKSDKHGYGRGGIPAKIEAFKGFSNELFNYTIETARRSNNAVILMGDNVEFDGEEPSFEGGSIWKTSGDIAQIKEFKTQPPDSSIFKLINDMKELMIEITGIDTKQLYLTKDISKFAVGLAQDTRNRKLTVLVEDLDRCYGTFLNYRLKNAHQFLKYIVLEDIFDDEIDTKSIGNKKILVKDKEIKTLGNGNIEVKNKPGIYSEFELNPEQLRGSLGVSVITGSTKNILKEVRKEDLKIMTDIMFRLFQLGSTNQQVADAIQKVNIGDYIKLMFSTYDFDISKVVPDTNRSENEKKANDIFESIANIASNSGFQEADPNSPMNQQQPAQPNLQQPQQNPTAM